MVTDMEITALRDITSCTNVENYGSFG